MKIHKMNCPNCNGILEMNLSENSSSAFCPYCGQKFIIDDENKTQTINKNTNITKVFHKRYTDDADVIRAKTEDKASKQAGIFVAIIFLSMFILFFGIILYFQVNKCVAQREGKINAGYYQDLIGQDYKTVKAHFEAAGFTNIELIDLNDYGIAFWNDGKVAVISIGGNTDFESTDWFYPDTKIVISHH